MEFLVVVIYKVLEIAEVLNVCILPAIVRPLPSQHLINKLHDLMLNLTPENTTQHSRIERQSHTKEAQQPPK